MVRAGQAGGATICGMMKKIAVIQHVHNDGPGYFATWLHQEGLDFQVFHMYRGDTLPDGIRDFAGLCILGGPMSANDPLPYFPTLLAHIRECMDCGIPVIGHCLGGQLMSLSLGGTVQASDNKEIGWSELHSVDARAVHWFGTQSPLQLFQWHGESFSIPPQAALLLRGIHCHNQAFVVNDIHIGMQFHCEVDEAKVREWLTEGEEEIRTGTSPGVQSVQSMLDTLSGDLHISQTIAAKIYAKWARGLRT